MDNTAISPLDNWGNENDENENGARGPVVSRRNFLAASVAAAAALLLWPRRRAWADIPLGQGFYGQANGSCIKHGTDGIAVRSKWKEWNCYSGQTLRCAFALQVVCVCSNELYDIVNVQPLGACGDDNWVTSHRLWFSVYDDNWMNYWVDGSMVLDTRTQSNTGFAFTNEELSSAKGAGYNVGFKSFGYPGMTYVYRRQPGVSSHWYGIEFHLYNVVSDGVNNWTSAYGAQFWNSATSNTSECYGDIEAKLNRNFLKNRWDLFGGIFKILTAIPNSSEQCVDVCGKFAAHGTDVWSWGYYGSTSQLWMVCMADVDDMNKGHRACLYPVHAPVRGLAEPGGSGGPSGAATTGHNAKIYTQVSSQTWNGHSERQFWIGGADGKILEHTYLTCDATGRVLDMANGTPGDYNPIQFHSNGYDGQWDNSARQWDFVEVEFEGSATVEDAGDGLSKAAGSYMPHDAGETGATPILYRFYGTDDADDELEEDHARVMACWMRSTMDSVGDRRMFGATDGIRAYRAVGYSHECGILGQTLRDVKLWIEHSKWPGEIHCRLYYDSDKTDFGEAVGTAVENPGNIVHGGLNPVYEDMSGDPYDWGRFIQNGDAGKLENVSIADAPLSGVSSGIRITVGRKTENSYLGFLQDYAKLESGKSYTISCWVKSSRAGVPCRIEPFWKDGVATDYGLDFEGSGEWQRVRFTNVAPDSAMYRIALVYIRTNDASAEVGDALEVCGIRLDEGVEPGEWPEAAWANGRSAAKDAKWAEIWLEGEIAEHYDVDARAYTVGTGDWKAHSYSDSDGSHAIVGGNTQIGAMQIRLVRKPKGAKLLREFSEEADFQVPDGVEQKYLWAAAEMAVKCPDAAQRAAEGSNYASFDWMTDRFRGTVVSDAIPTPKRGFRVRYYVDGGDEPVYSDLWKEADAPYAANPEAKSAAQRDGCLEVACWFTDPECTQPYEPRVLEADLKLYAYNRCTLSYSTTTRSCVLDESFSWKADQALSRDLVLEDVYPATSIVRWGSTADIEGPFEAYCEDGGRVRSVISGEAYADPSASGSSLSAVKLMGNSTVYVDWPWAGYDGVSSAW